MQIMEMSKPDMIQKLPQSFLRQIEISSKKRIEWLFDRMQNIHETV
jgi:hypothetical protein